MQTLSSARRGIGPNPRHPLRRGLVAAGLILLLSGCAGTTIIASPSDCSSLIPDAWRKPVPAAPLPAEKADPLDQLKEWIGFGVAQSGQLEIANGRAADTLAIIQRCEARDRAAVKRKRVLGLF